mmetsp:Transcript_19170/g.64222  ORF Transcript_19170/g.64222 Transcript_19170/m.64222 type:complete len:235 (+) Transcript_19170:395-1099(+)
MSRMSTSSLAICRMPVTRILDPPISVHATGTSTARTPVRCARCRSSTSKAHRRVLRSRNRRFPVRRPRSLNPHCVSRTAPPMTRTTRRWKALMRRLRCQLRRATAARCRCAREPAARRGAAAGSPCPWKQASSRCRSEKRVAPSASAMSSSCPRAHSMPSLTANPLPQFMGSRRSRTQSSESLRANASATSPVRSWLPSSTTMTSQVKAGLSASRFCRYSIASVSMAPRRPSSL